MTGAVNSGKAARDRLSPAGIPSGSFQDIVLGLNAAGSVIQVLSDDSSLPVWEKGNVKGGGAKGGLTSRFDGIFQAAIKEISEHDRSHSVLHHEKLDATERWLEIHVTKVGEDAPEEVEYLFISRDVTNRNHREQTIKHLDQLAFLTSNYIFVVDADECITWVNEAFEKRTGYTLAEAVGKRPAEVLGHPVTDKDLKGHMHFEARVREETFEAEYRNFTREGAEYWVKNKVIPMRDENGAASGYIEIQTDVTDLELARRRLQAVISGADIGTWEFNLRTGNIAVNELYAEQLNLAPEMLESFNWENLLSLMHLDDLPEVNKIAQTFLDGKTDRFDYEFRVKNSSGGWKWVRAFGRAVSFSPKSGRPTMITGVQMDIDEQKKKAEALKLAEIAAHEAREAQRVAEQRILDIVSISPSWFWEQDAEGRFTFMSDSIERALGSKPSDFIGRKRSEYFSDSNRKDFQELDKLQNERKSVSGFVYTADNVQGENQKRWIQIEAEPVFTKDGEFSGYRGVGSDVTEVYLALEKADLANEAKSSFLAHASHELRTPLNGIIGMSQILEEATRDPEQVKMVETIRESGESLLTILSDLLDISKIEAGKLDLEEISFNPSDLVKKVEALYAPQCEQKDVSFNLLVGTGTDLPRRGDPHRIRQIINNLVSNAIKFTSEGEVTVRLSGQSGKPLVLEVSDTGIGMTQEQISRVFERFQQADQSITRRFGGTGLGLSIVKRIVEMMECEISAESTPGGGTTFRVTFPLPMDTDPVSQESESATRASITGLRILAAEDNEVNQLLLKTMLEPEGVELTVTCDGQEAVDAWVPELYDLLLFDISMPNKDGATALEEIRERESDLGHNETPAIAITANAMDHQVSEWIMRGFDAVVAKPTRREDLVNAIHLLTS